MNHLVKNEKHWFGLFMFSKLKTYFNCNLNIFFLQVHRPVVKSTGRPTVKFLFFPALYKALSEGIQ